MTKVKFLTIFFFVCITLSQPLFSRKSVKDLKSYKKTEKPAGRRRGWGWRADGLYLGLVPRGFYKSCNFCGQCFDDRFGAHKCRDFGWPVTDDSPVYFGIRGVGCQYFR